MPDLKMLNSTKYLYKLTFIKCSYERVAYRMKRKFYYCIIFGCFSEGYEVCNSYFMSFTNHKDVILFVNILMW